ncbi:M6 family metalloprotease domain-containing protein [Sabulibacter ruber]|uniref:M6 family metalloprotease domain-containing protein n=1 Tax=Sabulibacter ruber TaxID=2811901 RepID=UPI001A96FC9E|nr:M6 family metalloprotease domain-containing protein [Sabulibacter ruber]
MATPFFNQEFTFTQPDGTTLQVKGSGNQFHATFETLDGFTVIKDPVSGFFQYANLEFDELKPSGIIPEKANPNLLGFSKKLRSSPEVNRSMVYSSTGLTPGKTRWQTRIEERKAQLVKSALSDGPLLAPPTRETVGKFIGLCLLIQFPDVPGTITAKEVDDFCNKRGYSNYGNNGSVYDYFYDVSAKKLEYNNIIAPYYTAKNPRSYYTDPKVNQSIRARELILEALNHHKNNGFDFKRLTSDSQNYVYAINVFYSGEVVNNWAEGLWPHCYSLSSPFQLASGKNAYDYQITNMGQQLSLGTFCHENGHMICDFPDLYDYGNESSGIGHFCLMCGGNNADPKNPVEVGGYLKYKAGWTDILHHLDNGMKGKFSSKNEFYIKRKNNAEYFIIENRVQSARDKALPDEGLAVWHIDELGSNHNEQMLPDYHYECSLIQADNRFDLESRKWHPGDKDDLFKTGSFGPSTSPDSNWWDGSSSQLEIKNIKKVGSNIDFDVTIHPLT